MGSIVGILGALLWYGAVVITTFEVGYLAVIIGWLIGKAVSVGSGNNDGLTLKLMSIGLAIVTMALAEYFIIHHYIVEAISMLDPTKQVPLFLDPSVSLKMIGLGLQHDPWTVLFWLIALLAAYRGCTV